MSFLVDERIEEYAERTRRRTTAFWPSWRRRRSRR
jgi:hypothetical protein